MNPEAITLHPEDEAAWLAMRRADLTSTQSAALFRLPAYGATELSLWHAKRQGVDLPFEDNDRVRWGRRLEAAIAYGIAEDNGWIIEPMKQYMRIPGLRIGSSFDYVILNHPCGQPVHLEIKNVDGLAFKDGWIVREDGELEAPPIIEMQVQHQMLVSGYPLAIVGALVGGNTVKLIERPRYEAVITAIRAKAQEFWASIDANTPPPATYPEDAKTMLWLYDKSTDGKVFDATNDAKIATLVLDYESAKEQIKELEAHADTVKAMIVEQIKDAERVIADWGKISFKKSLDSKGTLVTPEMVGTYVGARKGSRKFLLYMKKS